MIKVFSVGEDIGMHRKGGVVRRSMFVDGTRVSSPQSGEGDLADALNYIEKLGYSVISVLDARSGQGLSDPFNIRAYTVIARTP